MIEETITELAASALKMTHRMPQGALSSSARIFPFAAGGSNRYFFRLSDDTRSAVAMIEPGGGRQFDDYVSIGKFLFRHGVRVPEFYFFDSRKGVIIMEDLGDLSLEITAKNSDIENVIPLYKECMDELCLLQTTVTSKMEEENLLEDKFFGERELLGETEYFVREFAARFIPGELPPSWEAERRRLAEIISKEKPVFMHRDFQSRNIIVNNREPRLIDFQTAYRGPGVYDAASILYDPYVSLPSSSVDELSSYLFERLEESGAVEAKSYENYIELLDGAAIQRNLQALAAFAKLGYEDGKKQFVKSIIPGLEMIRRETENNGNYPGIRETALRALDKISDDGIYGM